MTILRSKTTVEATEELINNIEIAQKDPCNCNPHVICPQCLVGRG